MNSGEPAAAEVSEVRSFAPSERKRRRSEYHVEREGIEGERIRLEAQMAVDKVSEYRRAEVMRGELQGRRSGEPQNSLATHHLYTQSEHRQSTPYPDYLLLA